MVPHSLVGLLVVAQVAGAMGGMGSGFGGPAALYSIDGYLDRSPEGTRVRNTAVVGAGERRRPLLLLAYHRVGSGGDRSQLVRALGHFDPDFTLRGTAADIATFFDAPPGSRVRGTFKYTPGARSLLINELTIDQPREAGSG